MSLGTWTSEGLPLRRWRFPLPPGSRVGRSGVFLDLRSRPCAPDHWHHDDHRFRCLRYVSQQWLRIDMRSDADVILSRDIHAAISSPDSNVHVQKQKLRRGQHSLSRRWGCLLLCKQ
jgi:hypothetical protein